MHHPPRVQVSVGWTSFEMGQVKLNIDRTSRGDVAASCGQLISGSDGERLVEYAK